MTQDIVANEYTSLRGEAMDNRKIQVQIAFASPTLIAAIIGLLFSAKGTTSETLFPWLFLIPIPLVAFNMMLILERAKSSVRIVAYIEKFLEIEHPSVGWETRLELWRSRQIRKGSLSQLPKGLFKTLLNFSLLQIPRIVIRSQKGQFRNERYLDWNFYTITGVIHLFLCLVLIVISITLGYKSMFQNQFLLVGIILTAMFVFNIIIHVTWEIYTMFEFKQECRQFWETVRKEETNEKRSL